MKISIRKGNKKDIPTIIAWNKKMAMETEEKILNQKISTQGVKNFFNKPSLGFYLIAEIGKVSAGQLMITYEWSDWRNGLFLWIQSVYVEPKFRNKKVFSHLYKFVERDAKKRKDVCGIRLYVEKENLRAQKVYKKMGMNLSHYKMFEVDFVL